MQNQMHELKEQADELQRSICPIAQAGVAEEKYGINI